MEIFWDEFTLLQNKHPLKLMGAPSLSFLYFVDCNQNLSCNIYSNNEYKKVDLWEVIRK